MNYVIKSRASYDAVSAAADRVEFIDLDPAVEGLREAALAGLALPHKAIPPKFLYDAQGAALFEDICTLPEYYPTRSEVEILRRHPQRGRDFAPPCARYCRSYGAARPAGGIWRRRR
jgi:hypothetical protein